MIKPFPENQSIERTKEKTMRARTIPTLTLTRTLTRLLALSAVVAVAAGCSTPRPPPPPPIVMPSAPVASAPVPTVAQQEAMSGTYASFGQLRTVIRATERVIDAQGRTTDVREIAPLMERELVLRNFRLFNQVMATPTDLAAITRRTHAHLVIDLDARAEFVNSTGQFNRYRAHADIRAVRPMDGTIVSSLRLEEIGPRNQKPDRAGLLALRELAEPASTQLIQDLFDKAGQLRWFGLSVNPVATQNLAVQIRQTLAAQPHVDYVELLSWDGESQTAHFEVVHGLQHESDIPALLERVPRLRPRSTQAGDSQMSIFRNRLTHYK
jgi:hypothetical protein